MLVFFVVSIYFNKSISIVKFIVLFKIVGNIVFSIFSIGSLHGGNPPQIETVGRYVYYEVSILSELL